VKRKKQEQIVIL
jgi:hypothetical protein